MSANAHRNVVFLGATKGMGRALARAMAERGDALFLLGRDREELRRSAQDLEVRGAPSPVRSAPCDLEDGSSFAPALNAAKQALGSVDTIVVTAGLFAAQEQLERDPELAARVLSVNFTSTVLFCEAARKLLLARGGGTLCVFSSVAGERGRKPVVMYGASKAGLTRYLEGLDTKFRSAGLRVVTVKPGFVKTTMTQGLRPPPFAAEPAEITARVLAAIDSGRPVVYAPAPWRYIMMAIRSLPRPVMRRLSF
jgi:decaprenylphospho-beta-D-erythro-pentofuranosid-2-ulose 2-reductase